MKKTLTIALSMVLVAAIAVTGTLAFLTDDSEVLINKFKFGNTEVEIAEPTWDAALGEEEAMKVVPGETVDKDPTVTVKGTEEVYVYAYVNNALADYVTIGAIDDAKWTPVVGLDGLYRYNDTVTPAADGTKLDPLFETVTISETVTQKMLEENNPFTNGTITVQAYVHQAKEIGDTPVATADAAAVAFFTKTAVGE